MPRYLWIDENTGRELDVDASISDRDVPPTEEGNWKRALTPPNFTRRTFIDGQRAKTDQNYDRLKKASQLEIDHASATDKGERDRIRKSINELTTVKK